MKKLITFLIVLFIIFLFTIAGLGYLVWDKYYNKEVTVLPFTPDSQVTEFSAFQTNDEFYDYLATANDYSNMSGLSSLNYSSRDYGWGDVLEDFSFDNALPTMESAIPTSGLKEAGGGDGYAPEPDRYSETNVQVTGIDEPDIIKTNGQQIFYSYDEYYYPYYRYDYDFEYDYQEPASQVIQAFPPEQLEQLSEIKENGDLLLSDNNLVVIGYESVTGYDVSEPANPQEIWQYEFNSNTSYVTARLHNNQIYLITRTDMYYAPSCPLPVLESSEEIISIPCTSIYHPGTIVESDATYSILQINPSTGRQTQNISFVGSYDNTVVYMSPNSIYVAYSVRENLLNLFLGFLTENPDLFPNTINNRLSEINGYDISDSSKLNELNIEIDKYLNSLNDDDRLKFDNDFQNAIDGYLVKNKRQLTTSQINKINIASFDVEAVGEVPGKLLNQFSLDEYQNHLRVATTIGDDWYPYPFYLSSDESTNDVIILDGNLKQTGEITDLGEGERVYSARFIGDEGYVVTFRETDPFYVFDLSNPNNPVKTGELKIPGYSSYLHPLTDDLILGIGRDDSQVKASLFNVSDPSNPTEIDKYYLKNEYWSDILDTHHAFLQDATHEIFFLPGSSGGYIFSYADNQLELAKAVSDIAAERALYIDDYLYLVGYDQIIVLDENDWERVGELEI